MHAYLMGLSLALFAQLGDGRYANDAEGAEPTSAADAAADAETSPPASQIVIPVDTPQPTLVDDPSAAEPPTPATANPADAAVPLGDVVAPAGAEDTAAESAVLGEAPKPADLMRNLLIAPMSGQLSGVPITLGAAVGKATTRQAQTERVQAYWELSAAVAQYYLALQEAQELAALLQGVAAPSAAWAVAEQDFEARVELTRQAAIAAQLQLQRVMGATASASLPLPADSPHCGRYNTRYDEIFVGRTVPAAHQLSELLPLLQGELAAGARLVAEANDWLNFVSEHRDPATDGTGLLRAYELMSLRRRTFIDAARQYNDRIAAYAQLAAPDQVAPDQVVSMLIRVSTAAADGGDAASGVQPAGAIDEPSASDGSGGMASQRSGGARRTFAERQRMEVRRPFSRFRNRERSILVNRRLLPRLGRD